MTRIESIVNCLFPKEGKEPTHEELEFQMKTAIDVAGSPYAHIHALPYDQIGQWYAKTDSLKSPRPIQPNRLFYPDWYRITPAYSIKYAGMTPKQHIVSFFNPQSKNNLVQRARRWIQEPQMVVYCDNAYKLSTLFSVFVLLMTFLIAIWKIRVNAQTKYVIPELENKQVLTKEEQDRLNGLNRLNEITAHSLWRYGMPLLTFLAGMVTAWNVYKRTTRPHSGTEITDLIKGEATWKYRSEKPDATISRAKTINNLFNRNTTTNKISVMPKN